MKKILSVLLCLILAFAATGCTGDGGENSSSGSYLSGKDNAVTEPIVWYTDGVTLTEKQLKAAADMKYQKPKNVIMMISDGMGLNDIIIAEKFSETLNDYGVTFEHLPNIGEVTTHDIKGGVTDSAASATALATGVKTYSGQVGMKNRENSSKADNLKNVCEYAREAGKKVGIVTNDSVLGATPASFTVHASTRYRTTTIVEGFLDFKPDVLIGNGYADFMKIAERDANKDKLAQINVANGFDKFKAALNDTSKSNLPFLGFHHFDLDAEENYLAQSTQIALNKLENENGFFLMVEGAACDKAGHAGVAQRKVTGVGVFDRAVAVAIDYCMKNPDTVLVITSDHETGGVTIPSGDYPLDENIFTILEHTGVNVGVFALGYGTEYFDDTVVDNTDIGKFLIAAVQGKELPKK